MKVIIAGSRQIEDARALQETIDAAGWEIDEVVSGACRGVDVMGEEWAHSQGIAVKQFHADWVAHGREAGALRNRAMAEYADGLILLWDGQSQGATCMLREANRAGIKIHAQIYGLDMQRLDETEQAIIDYYNAGKGRIVYENESWNWEYADEDAPELSDAVISELIRQKILVSKTIQVLNLKS
ncbi:MAG: DUF2493 domain-containing protein [Gammaproteobacteria bacterium]|nr:DUF2493 domain-containing protein [Gammaproteobacteria bacterium]